jgi:hypothetical protein
LRDGIAHRHVSVSLESPSRVDDLIWPLALGDGGEWERSDKSAVL